MTKVHWKLGLRLEELIIARRKYHDKKCTPIKSFTKGDLVVLNGRIIEAQHRCKKLEDKMLGPFQFVSVGSDSRYCKLHLAVS
jgi:hypothetical protein